jgi:phosphohistidine swiveling domain-containing protein
LPADAAFDPREAAERLGEPTWVLVRTPTTSTGASFAALTLLHPAGPAAELDAAVSSASACFGISSSRFTSTLSARARAGEEPGADEALRTIAAAGGATFPPPSWDRVREVVARARAKAPGTTLLLQALHANRTYGSLTSRDARTGDATMRVSSGASPLAAFEGGPGAKPLEEANDLAPEVKSALGTLARDLELDLGRPVRIAFEVERDRVRLVAVHPLRRFGLSAFALASDLLDRGVPIEDVVHLVGSEDVTAAVPLQIDVDPLAMQVTGIAAGAGIAEGRVCLSSEGAIALAKAGHRPILFVHDIEPRDIEALRVSAAVVTVRGGLTGEAAVMARGLSKPCVASGAGMTLHDDRVQTTDGSTIRARERVTIDGSRGLIVRGSHPRVLGELPKPVAAILRGLEPLDVDVVAAVDHPAHVVSAHRLHARDVVVTGPEAIRTDAELRHGDPDRVEEAILAIFEAARDVFGRIFVGGTSVPARFLEAARAASRQTGVELVVDGTAVEEAIGRAVSPDAIVAHRILAARRAPLP